MRDNNAVTNGVLSVRSAYVRGEAIDTTMLVFATAAVRDRSRPEFSDDRTASCGPSLLAGTGSGQIIGRPTIPFVYLGFIMGTRITALYDGGIGVSIDQPHRIRITDPSRRPIVLAAV